MDPVTHGLSSYALSRACFPRAPRLAVAAIVLVGTLADLDYLSSLFGPTAFLAAHRTFTHSLAGTLLIAALVAGIYVLLGRRFEAKLVSASTILVATLLAAALHVALDLCQSEGVALFWPFHDRRYAADWIAGIDPWILVILLAATLFPALFRLITEEIGARSKKPRGRRGAILGLGLIVLYLIFRITFHASAVATLSARTYAGESARRAAAFPKPASPFEWLGLVETERAFHELPVNVGPGASFDPEAGITIFKPESSPMLEAASGTEAARRFLRSARFPKATVERTDTGYRVEFRELAFPNQANIGRRVEAIVELNSAAKVVSQKLSWDERERQVWFR